ncbi:hypothetical protein QFC22_005363 [Naganishia vaughanmartiniae]|uniref:Uncharacterized protein n=1 Tax=Naganishia vaughanmartiniae TaxID=1424756 RepID=A0ACC2WV35_9TREE|nr:hypothetical protein QFC22_005363 [Naganishia vaughanmartiniae]
MGLALDYGSDSDEESNPPQPQPATPATPAPIPTAESTSFLNLPPPKNKKRPLKIGFDHPLLSAPRLSTTQTENEQDEEPRRSAKKQRTTEDDAQPPSQPSVSKEKGKGKSALLDMLPPPKRALPVRPSTSKSTSASPGTQNTLLPRTVKPPPTEPTTTPAQAEEAEPAEIEFDPFGLATASPTSLPSVKQTTSAPPIPATISSAPAITEYTPPIPTAQDPYPGYYPLPSGSWAAYDPQYYASFFPSSSASSGNNAAAEAARLVEAGAMGRGWSGVQDEEGGAVHVDVRKGLEEARKEQDDLKRITAPTLYAEENTYKSVGKTLGKAGQRHQLSALLKDAHANRQALEERIAQNKRTKKESGGRYGF